MKITAEQEAFALKLIDGALSIFENADRLFYEGGVLADVGAFPRAYLMHQISMEECGKIEILGAAVVQCLSGEEVSVKTISTAFRRHESKNKINAYFLPRSEAEIAAIEVDDAAAAVSAFKAVQKDFHEESNGLKNSSLYVDFKDEFITPQDSISKDDYERIRSLNAEFMSLNNLKVKMLSRWREDLSSSADEIQEMLLQLKKDDTQELLTLKAREEKVESMFKALADSRRACSGE
ncbi:AbiV family abortive infection protein [Pseudomonas guariconensis]|uniref:AbiV family abortive infection protein n=1 Tax=Pseudomonas guariconensis TaxID=1288410 RepID=UPI0018A8E90F|nr:AbiV family abortive infection protein [Pseudomonas guariconensis]MBF8740017.1 AbiV family abortive infection protein [Pseudomonas guariconensis]MBF8749288.1 AbiV family abortive infection protein [Pseudomonas guariconensis]